MACHLENCTFDNKAEITSHMCFLIFRARCNIYISRLCYDVSVCPSVRLSVTEVHWRIIANLGFKFRSKIYRALWSQPTMRPHTLRIAVHAGALWSRCMPGRGEGSSRAMPLLGPLVYVNVS